MLKIIKKIVLKKILNDQFIELLIRQCEKKILKSVEF